jgi:uncharacterized protein (DUF885 family)
LKKQLLVSILLIFSFVLPSCSSVPQTYTPNLSETAAPTIEQFVDISFKDLLRRDPELVTVLGVSDLLGTKNDQLTPLDDAYLKETQQLETQTLENLHRYDRSALTTDQQQLYDTYEWYLDDLVRNHKFTYGNYLVSQMIDSPDKVLIQLFRDQQPVRSAADARVFIQRLGQINPKMEQVVAGLEMRRQTGVVLPAFLIDWTLSGIEPLTTGDATSSPFYEGLQQKLALLSNIPPAEQETLLTETRKTVEDSVQPGFQRLVDELIRLKKDAPQGIGVGSHPDGIAYYTYLLRHHTSTDLSAEEIHQIGLDELDKIHAEMQQVSDRLGYPEDESLPDLYDRVARDGGVLSGDLVYKEFNKKIEQTKTASASYFNLYPKADVVVQPDPIGGYYIPPSLDGSRPGIFYAQTEGSIPYYVIPTLTYHETIPGHHTELALVGELGMPLFQSAASFNGYTEGWALYAEKLMAESGVYENDPYGYLGYLQYAARRAARLVIDTGIHTKGWEFDQATRFMVDNTGMGERESQYEAARMAVMPGQAVSYYIGCLKILELREKARTALGDKFDIRDFHNVVLSLGPVPLSVLEHAVDDYIEKTR